MGKPTGKCPLGRTRKKCEDDIKMDHREVGCKDGRGSSFRTASNCVLLVLALSKLLVPLLSCLVKNIPRPI
jgi:hypothetical protein